MPLTTEKYYVTMFSRRDVTVRPGAIDISTLTHFAPPLSLASRATAAEATRTTYIVIGVAVVVGLIIVGIFCAVVLCLMYRKQQQRKKRNLDLGVSNAKHKYLPVDDMEMQHGGVHEMPVDDSFSGYKTELPSVVNEIPRVQQLDGFVAPPKPSAQPTELPSNAHVYKDDYR